MEIVKSGDFVYYIGVHNQLEESVAIDDCYFSLFCTNVTHFWIYQQTEADFVTLYETLNPSLDAPSSRILRHIIECIKEDSCVAKRQTRDGRNILSLKIESNLARLPFRWQVDMQPASPKMVHQIFTAPLLGLCSELQRRQTELFATYHHKDKELNKVALNYGVRIFPNKKHPDFDSLEAFDKAMTSDEESLRTSASSGNDGNIFSQRDVNSLLVLLMRAQTDPDTAKSSSASLTPRSSPAKSTPNKAESPSKPAADVEEERRLQLKKKLETQEVKPKNKKKKKGLF